MNRLLKVAHLRGFPRSESLGESHSESCDDSTNPRVCGSRGDFLGVAPSDQIVREAELASPESLR
jgi:hypothetical protein